MSHFIGQILFTKDENIVFMEAKGEAVDKVDFELDFGYHKERSKKRPNVALRSVFALRRPLPLFEVFPGLNRIPVRLFFDFLWNLLVHSKFNPYICICLLS